MCLPFSRPSVFPRHSIVPLRTACVLANEPWLGDFIRAVYAANFAEDRDIGDPAIVAEIVRALGHDPVPVMAAAGSAAGRGALRANTQRAIELGIFGAPNCIAWAREGRLR